MKRILLVNAANQVIYLFDGPNGERTNVPDFVTNAVMDAVIQASHVKGIYPFRANKDELEGFDPEKLADLFAVSHMLDIGPKSNETRLARALAEILSNPITPVELHNSTGDFVTELCTAQLMDNSAETIKEALQRKATAAKAEREARGGQE